jgi:uncharacterized membrane protein
MRPSQFAVIIGLCLAWGTIYAMEVAPATGTPLDLVQILHGYGLAGLAGLLIYAQWRGHERMAAALDRHETLLLALVEKNASLAERCANEARALTNELRERPCMRTKDDGK